MVIDDAVESPPAVPVVRGRVGGEGEGVGAEVQGEVGEAGAVEPFRNRSNDPSICRSGSPASALKASTPDAVRNFSVWCGSSGDYGGLLVNEIIGPNYLSTRYSGVHSAILSRVSLRIFKPYSSDKPW